MEFYNKMMMMRSEWESGFVLNRNGRLVYYKEGSKRNEAYCCQSEWTWHMGEAQFQPLTEMSTIGRPYRHL
jgi:hypothetical protein